MKSKCIVCKKKVEGDAYGYGGYWIHKDCGTADALQRIVNGREHSKWLREVHSKLPE
jgi:hypothetical protein